MVSDLDKPVKVTDSRSRGWFLALALTKYNRAKLQYAAVGMQIHKISQRSPHFNQFA